MSLVKRILFAIICLCLLSSQAFAKEIRVAVAANFTAPMKELAELYSNKTGVDVVCTFGSTGMLYGQITKGAPYDLFFAADEKRPALLFEEGLAEKPALYAKGKAVLWSADASKANITDWKSVVTDPAIRKVGISNPKTAPYGLRATEAMKKAGIYKEVEPKLVFGKNVGMAFQYGYSGSAEVTFIALSQALSEKGKKGTYWVMEEAGPVHQASCILKRGDMDACAKFLAWMKTPEARKIIVSYGYE